MIDPEQITRLHAEAVDRWHGGEIDNPYKEFLRAVCEEHACNFRLWHQEDLARSRDADAEQIAAIKRAIDKLNQQRNDWIEKLDELLLEQLAAAGVFPPAEAPLNTETPGSAIDRLSILSLRIHHLREIVEADPPESPRRRQAETRATVCLAQREDLAGALGELLADLQAGRKRLRVYRQLKMYNDPRFNPHLGAGEESGE